MAGGAPGDNAIAGLTSPGSWSRFLAAGYALLVMAVGTNLPSPLYAFYQARFGFAALVTTLIVAVYAGVVVGTLLLAGSLADVVGPRWVVVPALATAGVGALLFALARSTAWLFAARVAQGLAVGMATAALTAALVMTEPTANRARGSLLASTMTTGGGGFGALLAGILAQYGPQPLRLPYVVELGLLLPAIVFALRLSGPRRDAKRWRPRWPKIPRAARRHFALIGTVSFLAWGVAYIALALAPSYLSAILHTANLAVGGASAGLLLMVAAATQFGFSKWPPGRAEAVGLALLAIGLMGLIAAGFVSSIGLVLITIAIAGAGQGLAFMGAVRLANDMARPGHEAGLSAAFWVASYVGGALPVIGVGLLATEVGLVRAVQMSALVLAVACILCLVAVCAETRRLDCR